METLSIFPKLWCHFVFPTSWIFLICKTLFSFGSFCIWITVACPVFYISNLQITSVNVRLLAWWLVSILHYFPLFSLVSLWVLVLFEHFSFVYAYLILTCSFNFFIPGNVDKIPFVLDFHVLLWNCWNGLFFSFCLRFLRCPNQCILN